MTNAYCNVLGIEIPDLQAVKDHREANTYALLIVALLERGGAMTLSEVAERLEVAGVAPGERVLASLKRCKPARAPVYRDGERYALDPYDAELDLWLFRLGLRPPKVPRLSVVRPDPRPLPGLNESLTPAELDEAWSDASLRGWSNQRIVLAVLDAHGEPMLPEEVVAFVAQRTRWHSLKPDSAKFQRRGSAVEVRDDGRWVITQGEDALLSARKAVRDRVQVARRSASMRPDPAVIAANRRAAERRRAAHAAELAQMRRVVLYAFPMKAPEAIVLLDVRERNLESYVGEEIAKASARLDDYDSIAAIEVRPLLRALDFEPGERRLAELGPPQKTKQVNRRGRTLKITAELLVQGSCGISRPFGDERKLRQYLRDGKNTKLRRRLEADARSLFALYEYGRLHGSVRLRWGFLDELIPAPWVHPDELTFYGLKRRALERHLPLEVVVGRSPGWSDPWSRAQRCWVEEEPGGYGIWLVDEDGSVIDEPDVQLARISAAGSLS